MISVTKTFFSLLLCKFTQHCNKLYDFVFKMDKKENLNEELFFYYFFFSISIKEIVVVVS